MAGYSTIYGVNYHSTPDFELRRADAQTMSFTDWQGYLGWTSRPPDPPGNQGYTIDNDGMHFYADTTAWQAMSAAGTYGPNCRVRATGTGAVMARFAAILPRAGTYRVNTRWPADSTRSTHVTVYVKHLGGMTPVVVNQRENGSQWNSLGSYNFDSATAAEVLVADSNMGSVAADGVWFEPVTARVEDALLY